MNKQPANPDCELCHGDGTIYVSRYGGNDPDGDDVPCPECFPENPRERGDDDGVEYADPRDEMERRERS